MREIAEHPRPASGAQRRLPPQDEQGWKGRAGPLGGSEAAQQAKSRVPSEVAHPVAQDSMGRWPRWEGNLPAWLTGPRGG